jgi:hypothetical protein
MVSRQIGVNGYAPGVDTAGHRPDMLKAVTREVRGRVKTSHPVMANEDNLPIFRPFGDDFLHQLLSEKCSTIDVNGIPLFPASNIDQWNLLPRTQPFGDFIRRDLYLLVCIMSGKDGGNDVVHRKVVIALANRGQSFIRTETATGAAANVVSPKKGSLSTRILLEKVCHRCTRIDCSRHAHGTQRYIISLENQKKRLPTSVPSPK